MLAVEALLGDPEEDGRGWLTVSNFWVVGLAKSRRGVDSVARAGAVVVAIGKGWEVVEDWRDRGRRTKSGECAVDVTAVVVPSMLLNLATHFSVGTNCVMCLRLWLDVPWMRGHGFGLSSS